MRMNWSDNIIRESGVIKKMDLHSIDLSNSTEDYIGKYCELLEILKYILVEQYNDDVKTNRRSTFNEYAKQGKHSPVLDDGFDFSIIRDICKLWNHKKHHGILKVTSYIISDNLPAIPRLDTRDKNSICNDLCIEDFLDLTLSELKKLLLLIHGKE